MATPRTIDDIRLKLERDIASFNHKLLEFHNHFAVDPVTALYRGDFIIRVIACRELWIAAQSNIDLAQKAQDPWEPQALWKRLEDQTSEELKRKAGHVPSSTSHLCNLVDNYRRLALTEFYNTVLYHGF
jgi:hypothetical protein